MDKPNVCRNTKRILDCRLYRKRTEIAPALECKTLQAYCNVEIVIRDLSKLNTASLLKEESEVKTSVPSML